jgi:hypothetical protein
MGYYNYDDFKLQNIHGGSHNAIYDVLNKMRNTKKFDYGCSLTETDPTFLNINCEEAKILKYILKINLRQKNKVEFIKDNKLQKKELTEYLLVLQDQVKPYINLGLEIIEERYNKNINKLKIYNLSNNYNKFLYKRDPYMKEVVSWFIEDYKKANPKKPESKDYVPDFRSVIHTVFKNGLKLTDEDPTKIDPETIPETLFYSSYSEKVVENLKNQKKNFSSRDDKKIIDQTIDLYRMFHNKFEKFIRVTKVQNM